MGWKNSPLTFSTGTETIADLANTYLQDPHYVPPGHPLDDLAAKQDMPKVASQDITVAKVIPPFTPHKANASDAPPVRLGGAPTQRDPCLPTTGNPLQYVNIILDDFIGLGQDPNAGRVQRTLMHAIDKVFRLLTPKDSLF